MLDSAATKFPSFYRSLNDREPDDVELSDLGVGDAEIASVEAELGLPLPDSYKELVRHSRAIHVNGGEFALVFPPWAHPALGGDDPPGPGWLCFADYWLDGDGDQVLFDTRDGLLGGEYPVWYYNHDGPSLRPLASTFRAWIESALSER